MQFISAIWSRKSLLFLCLSVASVVAFLPNVALGAVQLQWELDSATGRVTSVQEFNATTSVVSVFVSATTTNYLSGCPSHTAFTGVLTNSDVSTYDYRVTSGGFTNGGAGSGGCSAVGDYFYAIYQNFGTHNLLAYYKFYFNGSSTYAVNPERGTTWIESQVPLEKGYVYSTTSISTDALYSVGSNDVIDQNNVFVRGTWQSVKFAVTAYNQMLLGPAYFEDQVQGFDQELGFTNLFSSPATGTIKLKYEIYEKMYPPWWQFWNKTYTQRIIATDDTEFYLYAITDAEEMSKLHEQFVAENELAIVASQNECTENGTLSVSCLTSVAKSGGDTMLHTIPIGYGTRIFEIFSATSTSGEPIDLEMTFATSTPIAGTTISLDVRGTIEESIRSLNEDYDVGRAYDKFMTYWNLFWYLLLVFWILKQIYGGFDLDFTYNVNEKPNRTGHINTVDMRKGGKQKGDINMRS